MSFLTVTGKQEYFNKLKEACDKGAVGVVAAFTASWCDPCGPMMQWIDEQQKRFNSTIVYVTVDVEKNEELCDELKVDSVPHTIFYRPSLDRSQLTRVADVSGARMWELRQNLVSLYDDDEHAPQNFKDRGDYVKYLINRDKVTMFITGTPTRPMCGFTGRMMELFHEKKIHNFTYFDVMADDDLCEFIKKFTGWPTYPQIYVEGELIGGFDIIKELNEQGKLYEALKMEDPKKE